MYELHIRTLYIKFWRNSDEVNVTTTDAEGQKKESVIECE
jgi:hypothetical protein